jgi:hypothetical protein
MDIFLPGHWYHSRWSVTDSEYGGSTFTKTLVNFYQTAPFNRFCYRAVRNSWRAHAMRIVAAGLPTRTETITNKRYSEGLWHTEFIALLCSHKRITVYRLEVREHTNAVWEAYSSSVLSFWYLRETAYMINNTNNKFFMQYVYGVFGTIFLDIPTFIYLPLSMLLCWSLWAFHEFCNFDVLRRYFDRIN